MNIPPSIRAQFTGLTGLAAVIIAALAFGYMMKSCARPNGPEKLPPAIASTIDSLDRTKPDFTHKQDSIRTVVVRDTVASERYKAAARRLEVTAVAQGARADSLARLAGQQNDSAAAWRTAYDARTLEASQLRSTVSQLDSAFQSEKNARQSLAVAYGADTLRRIAVEQLNAGLRKAVDDLERPCRFARFISCPSRTTTGVVSAIVGAGAMYVVRQ
jgi:hypothetical protein